jgi:hypothetical protein
MAVAAHMLLLARACSIVIHGFTVASILDSTQWRAQPRNLKVLELWAGVGSVAAAARLRGLTAATFEKTDSPLQDFRALEGFLTAVGLIMGLSEGGLLAMAPTCSSFGFANVSRTKRSRANWAGDPDYPAAARGNWEAELACFFLCLALARGVQAFIENPAGSYLFSFLGPHLAPLVFLQAASTPRCAFSREPRGQRYHKPFKFVATGPWITRVIRPCPCGDAGHVPLMERNEKGQVTGVLDRMAASQAYPLALGQALVAAWQKAGQRSPDFLPDGPLPPLAPPGAPPGSTAALADDDDPWVQARRALAAASPAPAVQNQTPPARDSRRRLAPGPPGAPGAPAAEKTPQILNDLWAEVRAAPAALTPSLPDDDPWAAARQPMARSGSSRRLASSHSARHPRVATFQEDDPWAAARQLAR